MISVYMCVSIYIYIYIYMYVYIYIYMYMMYTITNDDHNGTGILVDRGETITYNQAHNLLNGLFRNCYRIMLLS